MFRRGTEAAHALRIGISSRHLRRLLLKHLGTRSDEPARSRRAHFTRRLLYETDLAFLDEVVGLAKDLCSCDRGALPVGIGIGDGHVDPFPPGVRALWRPGRAGASGSVDP